MARSRRDPSEASPRLTSPGTQRWPPKVLGEQHRPARGCTPPAGQTSKRKETCAGRDGVATVSKRKRKGYQELKQKRKDKHAGNTCRVTPPANDTNTTEARRRAAEETARSRRNPAEASPRPTSPRTKCRPPKVLVEEHRLLVDVRPRPVKHQKGREPARGGMGMQPSQKEKGEGIGNSNR